MMEPYVDICGYRIKARHVPVFLRTVDDAKEGIAIKDLTSTQAEAMAQAYGEAMKERFMQMWKHSGGK